MPLRWPVANSAALFALVVVLASPAVAEDGQFLLISDIHFDPFDDAALFDELQDQPADQWGAILDKSRPAGLNPRGTDSNFALLQSGLDDVHQRIPDPDFILYPGDLMAHHWISKYDALAPKSHEDDPQAYRAFTAKAIRFLALEFRRRYPETPIFATLGNDDSYCGDYRIEPDGPFLKMFAETWGPFAASGQEFQALRRTCAKGGYYSARLPQTRDQRLVVLNSIFFSVNYENACGTTTDTPALNQFQWLAQTLEQAEAAGESVWLLMHIPPGVNSFNTAKNWEAGDPPVGFWQPELMNRFLGLLQRFRSTIHVAFAGHTHMDDFRVLPTGEGSGAVCKIAPAVSPIFGNNPGYQVYQYDRRTGGLENYRTYFLTNLPANDSPADPKPGRWAFEYDFRDAYGLGALSARAVDRLAERLKDNDATRAHYRTYYGVSAPPEFTPRMFPVYRCAITNPRNTEFLKCLRESPLRKPNPAPAFPDRRPKASRIK